MSHAFIVLVPGFGETTSMESLAEAVHDAAFSRWKHFETLRFFFPKILHRWRSWWCYGLRELCEQVYVELVQALPAWLSEVRAQHSARGSTSTIDCVMNFVGYSIGGVVVRDVCCRLDHDEEVASLFSGDFSLRFGSMATFASPHCGVVCGVDSVLPIWCAGLMLSLCTEMVRDVKLDNDALESLCDDAHLTTLAKFKKRITFCNADGDVLVSYESASMSYNVVELQELRQAFAELPRRFPLCLSPRTYTALDEPAADIAPSGAKRTRLQRAQWMARRLRRVSWEVVPLSWSICAFKYGCGHAQLRTAAVRDAAASLIVEGMIRME
jgi:hypothetical protein